MDKIQVCTAVSTKGRESVKGVIIEISLVMYEDTPLTEKDSLDTHRAYWQMEADKMENALHDNLPGAVYDQLLGRMLERKSSHFIVSHKY